MQCVSFARLVDRQDWPGFCAFVFDLHVTILVASGNDGDRPSRRLVRKFLAFAADIRRKPSVFDGDDPAASTTTCTIKLALAMAGCSGMILNVKVTPRPPISIGVCFRRAGGVGA
jgi:hypothetical protein